MPYQKNWAASVAMKEGMPTLATRTPLMKPIRIPEPSATTTAIQPRSYSLNRTAKVKPEKPMIAGKHRSISPAPITKVSPMASRISGGSVDRKVV